MSKRKLTYKDFRSYFSNNMQNKDKHAFEKEMMKDAFEEEAFDGLSQLIESERNKDIEELKSTINSRTHQKKTLFPVWFKYAASILILVGIGISIVYLNSRHWQESMLKEQVSNEMEIMDSILIKAEKEIPVTSKDTFMEPEVEDLVADNKNITKEKQDIQKVKSTTLEKNTVAVVVEKDEEIITDDIIVETDKDEKIEHVEIEKSEELVEQEVLDYAEAQPKVEVAKKSREKSAGESPQILIRGTSTLSKSTENKYDSTVINGTVLGADDGLSIPGVSIVVKGNPTVGTTTNIDGQFSLLLADDENVKTLIASFVGMETMEIELEEDSSLIVYMESSSIGLDEIIVSGLASGVEYEKTETQWDSALPPDSLNRIEYKRLIETNFDLTKFEGFQGKYKIKVSFTINENGKPVHFSFKNIPDKIFSDEIIRIIKELGNWTPAKENNVKVSSQVKYTLRIKID